VRIWTLVRWVIFIAVLGWVGYSVAGAGWSYFATQELVDKTLLEASTRYRASIPGSQASTLATYVRNSIVTAARRDGLSIQAADVDVSTSPRVISATVRWSYPAISYQGVGLLVVPMSVKRSYVTTP